MFAISGFPRIERFKSTLPPPRRCGEDTYATSGESLPRTVGDARHPRGGVVSDLIDCQRTVERMLTDRRTLAEVEEYVEHCALDEMEKAGLWMLAWAHQDQATQLRLAKETLALVSSMRTTTA